MPWKPRSHAEDMRRRLGRKVTDAEYESKRRADPRLALAHKLRNTRRWREVRAMKLRRDPLCEDCLRHGVVRPAQQVHHSYPLVERPDLAYAIDTLVSICTTCHALREAAERRRPSSRPSGGTMDSRMR